MHKTLRLMFCQKQNKEHDDAHWATLQHVIDSLLPLGHHCHMLNPFN